MEKKEYLDTDSMKSKRYSSLKDAHVSSHLLSEKEWEEVEQKVRAHSMAMKLTEMRIKAGISQRVMAAALNCRQPRISEIESTSNARMSMSTVLKYVEVTHLSFDVEIEDGRRVIVRLPRKVRKLHPKVA
ncbi:MAG: XRE family transcriptional regulator [Akkermansia sp.]